MTGASSSESEYSSSSEIGSSTMVSGSTFAGLSSRAITGALTRKVLVMLLTPNPINGRFSIWDLDLDLLGLKNEELDDLGWELESAAPTPVALVTDVFSSIADVSQAVGPGGELGNSELLQQFLAEVLGVSGNQAVLVAGPLVPELLEDEIDLGGRTVGPTGGDAFPVGVVWVLGRRAAEDTAALVAVAVRPFHFAVDLDGDVEDATEIDAVFEELVHLDHHVVHGVVPFSAHG
nr:hypothetical protein Iba_scaffold446CG0290 [Ipomoea batatas]